MSASQDARDVSDDRNLPPGTPNDGRGDSTFRTYRYETTADGDVVITDPSFDNFVEDENPAKSTSSGPSWHSPGIRSSVAAKRHNRRHSRNLSAHFFDATKITEDDDEAQVNKTYAKVRPDVNPAASSPAASPCVGQKHRRMFSGDVSNPPLAHRRINSIGNAAAVDRFLQRPRTRHRREDSAGLDILSAAVDVTGDELADAAGAAARSSPSYWGDNLPPPSSASHHSRLSSLDFYDYGAPAPSSRPPAGPMKPPPSRTFPHPHTTPHHYAPPPPSMAAYHHPPPPTQGYYYPPPPQALTGHPLPPPPPAPRSAYPVQYSHRGHSGEQHVYKYPPTEESSGRQPSPTTPYGDEKIQSDERLFDNKTSETWSGSYPSPTCAPIESEQAQEGDGSYNSKSSSMSAHHRKLSSFSSITGALMGPPMFSSGSGAGNDGGDHPLKSHHRVTSSTVSFLNGLDVLEGSDVVFLRNLHQTTPNYGGQQTHASGPPPLGQTQETAPAPAPQGGNDSEDSPSFDPGSGSEGVTLAPGGTSKRVRRKCTVADCPNRVVQGGLCISHGAKRKICKHPGCNKNVKKAGLCSTHGPARKRCEADGCNKVAVQGGRCIAHGAKKKLCSVENCKKQAILSGMCKKHHDKLGGVDPNAAPLCVVINGSDASSQNGTARKGGHQRGLSIFQDLSADAVQNFLSGEDPLPL